MNLTEISFDQEYMISYLLGTDFENRMYDAYIGTSNNTRPPYLDELFFESAQMKALIQLEKTRKNPGQMNLTDHEWGQMYRKVWNNDESAKLDVISFADPKDYERLYVDIYTYLSRNHLSFLMRNSHPANVRKAALVYPPSVSVW